MKVNMKVNRFSFKDIFTIAKIIKEVDFSEVEFRKGKTQEEYALDAWGCILNSCEEVEYKVYALVASITEMEVKEVEKLDWEEVFEIVKEVIRINDMEKVFTQAKELILK